MLCLHQPPACGPGNLNSDPPGPFALMKQAGQESFGLKASETSGKARVQEE